MPEYLNHAEKPFQQVLEDLVKAECGKPIVSHNGMKRIEDQIFMVVTVADSDEGAIRKEFEINIREKFKEEE